MHCDRWASHPRGIFARPGRPQLFLPHRPTQPLVFSCRSCDYFPGRWVAYVEFGNVRFSTKQSKTPLTVFGSEKIQELIGDDERFEVAVNPQYLLDAINAVKSEKRIILNVGDPLRPITIRPDSGINQQMCGILPIRKHDSLLDSEESVRAEQRQKLKAIQRHLESLLATVRPAEGSSESAFWSKAVSFKADLDAYFTMQEEHSKEDQ